MYSVLPWCTLCYKLGLVVVLYIVNLYLIFSYFGLEKGVRISKPKIVSGNFENVCNDTAYSTGLDQTKGSKK